jgi:trimeric autotransporter adhesin
MSIKTLRKRIALVAVASLGFGLMATVPASATATSLLTNATLAVKSSPSDPSLQVLCTAIESRTKVCDVFTRLSTVAYADLNLTVVGTYGAAGSTYVTKISSALAVTANPITVARVATSATTAATAANGGSFNAADVDSTSTRVLPTTTSAVGTPIDGITTTTMATFTSGNYYLYVQPGTGTSNYVAGTDILITLNIGTNIATPVVATLDSSTTTIAGRVGQQVSIRPTADLTTLAAAARTFPTLRVAASLTSQPAVPAGGAVVYPQINAVTTLDSDLVFADSGTTIGTTAESASTGVAADATGPSAINYSGFGNVAVSGTDVVLGTVTFTPTVAGVYTLVVWNESSTSGLAALSGNESFQTFTINVASGISTIAITAINSTAAVDTATIENGSLLRVSLRDAAGNISIPATGEAITLTPSSTTAQFVKVNGNAVSSAAGAAYSLSAANFGQSGTAWVNMINTAAEAVTVVASYSGSASSSVAVTYRTTGDPATDSGATPFGTTGFRATASAIGGNGTTDYPVGAVTASFGIRGTFSSTTASYVGATVTDTVGAITGVNGSVVYTNDLAYDLAGTVGDDSLSATAATDGAILSVAFTTTAATANIFTIDAIDSASARTQTVSTAANQAGAATATPAVINAVAGATNTISVNLKDYFARNFANQTLTGVVTGRNPTTVARTALTDALGNATFTLTDANTTSVIASDVMTITGGSAAITVTVLYGAANAPATITLTSTGDTDVIPGTTTTDISAGASGATATSATASAVVRNSAGSAVAGVPVTFTVTGLVGAEVHTTKAVVYTNSTGTAVSNISSYAAGKATVTATAGTATASDDIYFAQNTPTEARTIAISAVGGLVKATVKDRYGNPIKGVAVNATRTGTGFFGAGSSTATGETDAKGEVEFNFVGSGTVTVAFTSATYGQSYAAAGFDFDAVNGTAITASAAGTSATNQAGLGAALAPAGINSASLAVEGANAAADSATAAACSS